MRGRRFITGTSQDGEPRSRDHRIAVASLLFIGLITGLVLALIYAWLIEPVNYIAASPAQLAEEYKEEYILMVSQSYALDNDWGKAKRRLDYLSEPDISAVVVAQMEQNLRDGEPAETLKKLAALADRLGASSPVVDLFVPKDGADVTVRPTTGRSTLEKASPSPILTPVATIAGSSTVRAIPIVQPTIEPSSTPMSIYLLLKKERICQRNSPLPLIEVLVYDAYLEPVPGVEVVVKWEGGVDTFFTGYQPDIGLGYADFIMEPEVLYSLELTNGSTVVENLAVESCGAEIGGLAGGWRLTFQSTEDQQATPEP